MCSVIIGLRALTGCDSLSAFAEKEKLTALKLVKGNSVDQVCFSKLEQSLVTSTEILDLIEEHLYVSKSTTSDVNECRYHFSARSEEISIHLSSRHAGIVYGNMYNVQPTMLAYGNVVSKLLLFPNPLNLGGQPTMKTFWQLSRWLSLRPLQLFGADEIQLHLYMW